MIKLLKITSILTVILAILTVALLGIFILKGKPEISIPDGVVEKFKKPDTDTSTGKTPPLVVQAKAFALKINPPKPVEIAKVESPTETNKLPVKPVISDPPPRPSKINLIATCRYEDTPDRSLALFDLSAKGLEWFRQGEPIEHLTVHEIKDGSVVLYQSGKFNQEIFMPKEVEDSLLKTAIVADTAPARVMPTKPGTTSRPASRTATLSEQRTPPSRVTKTAPVKQIPERTPEEEKAEIDKSISNVKKIMGGDDQSEEDKKAMAALLKLLQDSKEDVEE